MTGDSSPPQAQLGAPAPATAATAATVTTTVTAAAATTAVVAVSAVEAAVDGKADGNVPQSGGGGGDSWALSVGSTSAYDSPHKRLLYRTNAPTLLSFLAASTLG